jgi:hypothetical protein
MVPEASGTLAATPFPELLVQALDQRFTGTLVLEETNGARHGIYLEAGTPQKAKVAVPVAHLGRVLVEAGAITHEVHEDTLARALREHVLHGQLLLGEGRISEHTLELGLCEHLQRQLVALFRQPSGTHYGYFPGANFLARWGAATKLSASTLEVVWRGLLEHPPEAAIAEALARLGQRGLRLQRDLPEECFAFMGESSRLVALFTAGPRAWASSSRSNRRSNPSCVASRISCS